MTSFEISSRYDTFPVLLSRITVKSSSADMGTKIGIVPCSALYARRGVRYIPWELQPGEPVPRTVLKHYDDVIMGTIASQITSLTSVYSTVYSGADQSKHQSSASLAFVWGIHRGPVNSPHKWPVTRKMFPFDDVIMIIQPF